LTNASLQVPLLASRLTAGLDLHFVSSARTPAGGKASRFALVDLTLFSKDLPKGFELSGTIYNLFDKRHGFPGGGEHVQDVIVQDGRAARVKLSVRFGGAK
jgi:iron complex outermembrane receptor protein